MNDIMKSQYDIFLSFNSEDRDFVELIAIRLKDANFKPWFDEWELIPGESKREYIARGLKSSSSCAVFVGQSGEGPWQKKETDVALDRQTREENFRVIPVLLPNAPKKKKPELPSFLSINRWVDFREGFDDDDAFWQLECGIRGIAPGQGRPRPQLSGFHAALIELSEWKDIHHDVHDLLRKVNIPYENLLFGLSNPTPEILSYAVKKWEGDCLPTLKSVSRKLKRRLPDRYTSPLYRLQEQKAMLNNVVKNFNNADMSNIFFLFHGQLGKFQETVSDVLHTANDRIMVLVEHLQRSAEGTSYEHKISGFDQKV